MQLGPRGQKEKKGAREKRGAQEKMEWVCQASLAPQDLQGPCSMCRMKTEQL